MWYHKVAQETGDEGLCIAVNYWYDPLPTVLRALLICEVRRYDMEYSGPFYPTMSFIRNISAMTTQRENEAEKGPDTKSPDTQEALPFVMAPGTAYL